MALRKITRAVGRYKVGQEHDYPRGVWNKLAEDAGLGLNEFTAEVVNGSPLAQSPLKGRRPTIHKRLGASQ